MNDAGPAGWAWMFHGRYLGFTITFTHAVSPEELMRRYGVDPRAARDLPFVGIQAALQPGPDDAILRVGTLRDWAFAIEILGGQGKAPATLAEISRGTETIAVHAGASALDTLDYWVDGLPQETFEAGEAPTLRAAGAHPFWDATEWHRTAQPGTIAILAVMQAVEEHIGGRLTPDIDDGPLPSVVLPQILPPLPSPAPPLPPVNPSQPGRLGRYLGDFRPPKRG